ncbi:hypothetical protein BGZ94_000031 [Podila epigama]|nr:hypothetical protein BGZ94_000031 [Podila epigama]
MAADGQEQALQDNNKYQYFKSKGDVVRIEIHHDPKTGDRFVYWRDIQDCFKGLVRLQDGVTFIPMIRDEDGYRYPVNAEVQAEEPLPQFQARPTPQQKPRPQQKLQSQAQPLQQQQQQQQGDFTEDAKSKGLNIIDPSNDNKNDQSHIGGTTSTTTTITELKSADMAPADQDIHRSPLVKDSEQQARKGNGQSSPVVRKHATKAANEMTTESDEEASSRVERRVKSALESHLEASRLSKHLLAVFCLLEAIRVFDTEMGLVKQTNRKAFLQMLPARNQLTDAKHLLIRERTLFTKKRLSRILALDDVQMLIRQTLDEKVAGIAPNPDLQQDPLYFFVILPTAPTPGHQEFRVHFLCDRRHETSAAELDFVGDGVIERVFHIGEHPGYAIKDMGQFLKLFGSHVYSCLEMLWYGLTTDDATILPMHGSDEHYPLVTEAIHYLENWSAGSDIFKTVVEFEILQTRIARDLVKTVDMTNEPGDTLWGGLYRAVDDMGYGIVVCKQHFEAMAVRPLDTMDWVDPEDGYFLSKRGWLTLTCRTPEKTRDYLARIVEAQPRVLTLDLRLPWKVTSEDLYLLDTTLDDANIVNLILTCPQHPTPPEGFLGGDKRDPLFDIMVGRSLPGFILVDDSEPLPQPQPQPAGAAKTKGGTKQESKVDPKAGSKEEPKAESVVDIPSMEQRIRPRAMKLTCNTRNRHDDSEYLINVLKNVPKLTDLLVVIEGKLSASAFFKKLPQSFLKRISNLVLEDGEEDQAVFRLNKGKAISVDLEVEHWRESEFLDQPALKTLKILQPLNVKTDAVHLVKTIMPKKSLKSLHFVSEARDFAGMTACLLEPMVKHPVLESIMISDIRMSHLQLEHEKGAFPGTFISLQSSERSAELTGALRAIGAILNAIDFPKIENDQVAALLEGTGRSQTTSLYMVHLGIARLNHKGRSDLIKLINKSPIGVEDVEAGCSITFESHPLPHGLHLFNNKALPLPPSMGGPKSAGTASNSTDAGLPTAVATPKELADFIRGISGRLTKLVLKVNNLEEIVRAMSSVLWTEMRDFCSFQIIGFDPGALTGGYSSEQARHDGESNSSSNNSNSNSNSKTNTSTGSGKEVETSTKASRSGKAKTKGPLYLTPEGGGKSLVSLICMVGPLMTIGLQDFHMDISLWKMLFKKMTFGGLRTLHIHDLEYSNKELIQALIDSVQDRKVFALEEIGLRAPFLNLDASMNPLHGDAIQGRSVAGALAAAVAVAASTSDNAAADGSEDEFGLDARITHQLFGKFKKQIVLVHI